MKKTKAKNSCTHTRPEIITTKWFNDWAILAAAGERYRREEEERHKQWEMNQRLEEFRRERERMEKRNAIRDLFGI